MDVVIGPKTLSLDADDPGVTQLLEVVRERRLRDVEERDQLAHADLAGGLAKYVDELDANRIRESFCQRRETLRLGHVHIGNGDRDAARVSRRTLLLWSEH